MLAGAARHFSRSRVGPATDGSLFVSRSPRHRWSTTRLVPPSTAPRTGAADDVAATGGVVRPDRSRRTGPSYRLPMTTLSAEVWHRSSSESREVDAQPREPDHRGQAADDLRRTAELPEPVISEERRKRCCYKQGGCREAVPHGPTRDRRSI